jgi:chemotaxis signal transduction protein
VTETSRIVVVESKELVAGLLVDAMVDILDVPIVTFQALPASTADDARKYLDGQFYWREMTLALLNSDVLLQGLIVNQG